MILDANTLIPGAALTADVCIIGGGAAGITLALELRGSGLEVVLLESGAHEFDLPTQQLYEGTMSGLQGWDPFVWRIRQLGGSTNHWAGWCKPFRRQDFEVRDWMEHSGWPITYDDVAPYHLRAHQLLELGPVDFDPTPLAAAAGRDIHFGPDSAAQAEIYQLSTPTNFGERYRSQLEDAVNLGLYLNANLTEIRLAQSGEVDHLACATLGGVDFTVEADRYVLAMGGIENARMLLASNRQQPEGVANGSDQVGRNFMEHPHYRNGAAIVSESAHNLDFYDYWKLPVIDAQGEARDQLYRGAFSLTDEVRDAEQLPDWIALAVEGIPEDSGIAPLLPEAIGPSLFRCRGEESRFYRLYIRAEQRPIPDSRVTLGAASDALGIPKVEIDWRIHPDDVTSMVRSLEIFGAELGRHCLGRLWMPQEDGRITIAPMPGGHHMGTTRMGSDPATSVVDGDGRCHEVGNLYIAGSSVFCTGSAANPTLTIVALAARLARHLTDTAARR